MTLFAQSTLSELDRVKLENLMLKVESTSRAEQLAISNLNSVREEKASYQSQLSNMQQTICKTANLEIKDCQIDYKTGNVTKKETK